MLSPGFQAAKPEADSGDAGLAPLQAPRRASDWRD